MKTLAYVLTVLVYAGLVTLVVWIFVIRPRQPIKDRIVNLLQLVAVYTFMLGFLSSAGVFKSFDSLQREMTSPDPLAFLEGNLAAFAIIFSGMSVACNPNTSSSILRFLLGLPVLIGGALILFAYTIIHFLAIVPIVYFGYLVTSVPIDAILNSGSDIAFSRNNDAIRIKELVKQNEPAIRNFAVALPAFATSLVLKIGPLLRRKK